MLCSALSADEVFCDMVKSNRLCEKKLYRQFCCRTCLMNGWGTNNFLPPYCQSVLQKTVTTEVLSSEYMLLTVIYKELKLPLLCVIQQKKKGIKLIRHLRMKLFSCFSAGCWRIFKDLFKNGTFINYSIWNVYKYSNVHCTEHVKNCILMNDVVFKTTIHTHH